MAGAVPANQFSYLIPGNTSTAPTAPASSTPNQFASLIPATPPATAPKPTLLSSALGTAKSVATNAFADLIPSPVKAVASAVSSEVKPAISAAENTPVTPQEFSTTEPGQATIDAFNKAFSTGIDNIGANMQAVTDSHNTALQRGVAGGEVGIQTINTLFSTALSPLQGLATVPGAGYLVSGMNKIFAAIGAGSATGAASLIDSLPISQQTKDTIKPLAQDTAALAGQIVVGGEMAEGTGEAISKISDNSKQILTQLQNDPAIQEAIAKQTAPRIPVTTETPDTETQIPISRNKGNLLPAPPEFPKLQSPEQPMALLPEGKPNTPVPPVQGEGFTMSDKVNETNNEHMQAINKYRDAVSSFNDNPTPRKLTIVKNARQTLASFEPKESEVAEPTEEPVTPKQIKSPAQPVKSPIQVEPKEGESALETTEAPKTTHASSTLKPIEGTGALKTRGAALSIEAGAIEKGLTDNLGDLPEYKAVNFKEMAPKIADIFAKDPEGARAIAMGEKAAPKGTTPEMFAVTLEKDATTKGDVDTLKELANSKLTTAATTMGQRIASYAQRDELSVVSKIKEVQDAREAALKQKGIDQVAEATKDEKAFKQATKSARAPRQSWEDFTKSLTCAV